MKTVAEMVTWLNTPGHIKCILADITEVGNFVNSTVSNFFLSNVAYYGDNQNYNAAITGGLSFSESLNVDGQASLSFGSLEIVNTGGIHDTYLTSYIWNKRPIKVYLGDPSWPKQDFVLIFDGLIQEITAPNENTLSFTLFDKLQRLNDPISERTLTSLGTDRQAANLPAYSETALNNLLPLLFGEAFNIQPLLVDKGAATGSGQTYMVHDGAIEGVIEVRDNGVPITVTEGSSTGTFTLLTKPFGTITCSAQGRTPYTNTVPGIITQLVTNYGTQANRFTTGEISFSDFSNTSAVGFYCNDRTNILDACNQLAKSVNANLICPSIVVTNGVVSTSKLRLVEIKVPTGNSKYTLNDDNMILNSLSIQEMFPVKPSIKLGYCKNYTVQSTVSGGVNPQSRFDELYLPATAENITKKALYRDSGTVSEEETLLLVKSQAEAEAQKRLDLWQDQKYVITADYLPHLMFVQLGDTVTIQNARFGLNAGKLGMVYSVTRNWTTGIVSIGVLV
jgi:hypothetical protein